MYKIRLLVNIITKKQGQKKSIKTSIAFILTMALYFDIIVRTLTLKVMVMEKEFKISDCLHRLVKEMYRSIRLKMAKYGITPQQGRIIRFLALKNEEAIFQKDIEDFLNIRKSSVSNIIKNMEKTGFIIRSQVPNDARLKRIELTPAGRAIHEDAQLNNLMIEAKMRENLSEQEIEILEMILKKIQSNLEN